MATVLIPLAWPEAPDVRTTRWRHRLSQELPTLAGQVNHYACYRFLREAHRHIEYDDGGAHPRNDPPSSVSHRVIWPSHELAEFVWFILEYQADPSPSSGNTRIDLTLNDDTAGTVIDEPAGSVGVRLDLDQGDLEAEKEHWLGGTFNYETHHVNSGTRTFTPLSYPSLRRPLTIPSANQGSRFQIDLDCTNVRLLSVHIFEAVLESVDI